MDVRVEGFGPRQTPGPNTRPLTAQNDVVVAALLGCAWATAKFSVVGAAGAAKAAAEYSIDGGVNWLAAPYAKRLDTVAASPTVKAIADVALNTGEIWEVPLPGNCTNFRVRCSTAGSATVVQLAGGTPYIPGVPVLAVLYDVTEGGIGAGLATGILDFAGWVSAGLELVTPTTQVWAVQAVDDTGAGIGPIVSSTATSSESVLLGQNVPASTAVVAAGIAGVMPFTERRFKATLPAGGTVSTGRARITVRR